MIHVNTTQYAEDSFLQFQRRLSPQGKQLLSDCASEIVQKLEDDNLKYIPSATFPGTFVIESRSLWFAWYQVNGDGSITILHVLPRANAPLIDVQRSRS